MSDRLDEATRALRAHPVDHDRAADTRARLLAAAQRKRRSPRRRLVPWLVPLAAAFVATAALAGAGGRIAAWIAPTPPEPPAPSAAVRATTQATAAPRDAVTPTAIPEPNGATATSAAPEAPAAPPTVTTPAAPTTVPTIAPAPVAKAASEPRGATHDGVATANDRAVPPVTSAQPPSAQPPSATAQPEAPAAPAPAPAPDPSDELYRAAHDLHFRGGSPAAAIAAWDRYLAAAPSGRFALEAQYNRAIALLRAGRKAEGLAALRPFASGAHGAYRKTEAQRLLDAAADGGT